MPMIVLETALPAKFDATIREAIGRERRASGAPRRHRSAAAALHGDAGRRRAVKAFIAENDRRMNAPATARPPLLALDDALERILAAVAAPVADRAETVSTFDALGRVLAADVRSQLDVPPEDNSEMDGYARARRRRRRRRARVLPVSQRIAAGSVGTAARSRARRRASSPARRCPPGADAVVMQETVRARVDGARAHRCGVPRRPVDPPPRRGRRARRARARRAACGSTPQALGLAGVGRRRDAAGRAPAARRAVLDRRRAGDAGRAAASPGAIYNSNRFTLRGLLRALGCDVTTTSASSPTSLDATRAALRAARPRATT